MILTSDKMEIWNIAILSSLKKKFQSDLKYELLFHKMNQNLIEYAGINYILEYCVQSSDDSRLMFIGSTSVGLSASAGFVTAMMLLPDADSTRTPNEPFPLALMFAVTVTSFSSPSSPIT